MDAAVGQDGEFFAERNFCHLDGGEERRFLPAIEESSQGCKNSVVILGICPELGDRLCYQDIEPV